MSEGVSVRALVIASIAFGACTPRAAHAFGPLGHRVAGLLAETALCRAARDEIAAIGGGESLAELGVWADNVREIARLERSAAWHYMNVDEDGSTSGAGEAAALAAIRSFRSPPEGDVLSAIVRFRAEVADASLPARERAEALKFLVHFVVDVHQPLHVGRASDRGGNRVDVTYRGKSVTLHRFWDSDVLALRRLGAERYARRLAPRFDAAARPGPPAVWAAESLALRETVYAFARAAPAEGRAYALDADYVAAAQRVAEDRVVRAAERLAATLNEAFCGPAAR